MPELIVPYDTPDAAQKDSVFLWVSRLGNYFKSEASARYDGCTHKKCESCDKLARKERRWCDGCQDLQDRERYQKLPSEPWDGVSPLYSQVLDKYFYDLDMLADEVEEGADFIADLRVVLCEGQGPRLVDPYDLCTDRWPDDDDDELPQELLDACDAVNKIIREMKPLSYYPRKVRPQFVTDSDATGHKEE